MDPTVRRTLGVSVDDEGTYASFLLETVDGVHVEFRIVSEAMTEFLLKLAGARTKAWLKSEGGVPGEMPSLFGPSRPIIPASSANYVEVNGNRIIQIMTPEFAYFEFMIVDEASSLAKPDG